MDIKFIKLISGDDVVAEISGKTDTHYTLKNPIGFLPTPEGGLGMGPISPFMEMVKTIDIKLDHVVYMGEPQSQLSQAYRSQFGSGLVIPSTSASVKLKIN